MVKDNFRRAKYNYDEELALKAAVSYKKVYKKIIKIIISIVLCITGLAILLWAAVVGYVKISAQESKEIYKDVSEYALYRSGETQIDNFKLVEAADLIFPEEITADMDVQDYFMMYYNPWDANYLGYLAVQYDKAGYVMEAARLAEYSSTDYIGYYGITGFTSYEVLAMNASDSGFVYAITDGESMIIYVEMVFPGYGMDIKYEKYIPQEYLPEGLDATEDNPTRQAREKSQRRLPEL
jgi:hypothetical protein